MKKLILFISFALLLAWFSFAANISIMPSEGSVGLDCIEEFNISVDLWLGEKAIWADVLIDSNMEFVKFVKWDLFNYSAPVKVRWNRIKLFLFSNVENEITEWGNLWKLYFKVVWDIKKPYIHFVFN